MSFLKVEVENSFSGCWIKTKDVFLFLYLSQHVGVQTSATPLLLLSCLVLVLSWHKCKLAKMTFRNVRGYGLWREDQSFDAESVLCAPPCSYTDRCPWGLESSLPRTKSLWTLSSVNSILGEQNKNQWRECPTFCLPGKCFRCGRVPLTLSCDLPVRALVCMKKNQTKYETSNTGAVAVIFTFEKSNIVLNIYVLKFMYLFD